MRRPLAARPGLQDALNGCAGTLRAGMSTWRLWHAAGDAAMLGCLRRLLRVPGAHTRARSPHGGLGDWAMGLRWLAGKLRLPSGESSLGWFRSWTRDFCRRLWVPGAVRGGGREPQPLSAHLLSGRQNSLHCSACRPPAGVWRGEASSQPGGEADKRSGLRARESHTATAQRARLGSAESAAVAARKTAQAGPPAREAVSTRSSSWATSSGMRGCRGATPRRT